MSRHIGVNIPNSQDTEKRLKDWQTEEPEDLYRGGATGLRSSFLLDGKSQMTVGRKALWPPQNSCSENELTFQRGTARMDDLAFIKESFHQQPLKLNKALGLHTTRKEIYSSDHPAAGRNTGTLNNRPGLGCDSGRTLAEHLQGPGIDS